MTGILEAIWVIICFWPLTLVALTTSTSAPWAIMACIWFIWMTGSLLAAWNNSLKPLLLGDLLGLHLHGREVRGLQLLLGEADDDLVDVGLDPVRRALSGLLDG